MTDTAKLHGGKVQVYEDNLTDISENLFWFRETVDQNNEVATALLKQIVELLTNINKNLEHSSTNNFPQTLPVQSVQSVDKPLDKPTEPITPVVIDGQTYTSPKLMQVIKWLEGNPDRRNDTVREIADLTGVSKSWVAIAKKYEPVQ